jgi:predicted RND superfamily exporter protein
MLRAMSAGVPEVARRYASWIDRHRYAVVSLSIAFAACAALIASRLSIFADFSHLLPESAESVQHLRAIEKRARVIGTAMVAVKSADPAARKRAAHLLKDKIEALGPTLVSSVTFDHGAERRYGWEHRWLFAELLDLIRARDALTAELAQAKLDANPLYVSLDDAPAKADAGAKALRAKLKEAEGKKDDPDELVSKDETLQMMVIRTAFATGDAAKDRELLDPLGRIIGEVKAAVPGVDVGVAGDVSVSVAEQESILRGMLMATGVTMGLVLFGMLWYFRSLLAIGALSWSLTVGTLATFAFTKLTIGHLNLATAFLSSIVIGNGINFGILLVARYFEELRAGQDGVTALAAAMARTLAGTLTAALTAAVAYASLIITVFRGFRHFGIIGGVGILLCWISAFTVLPAALAIGYRFGMRPRAEAPIGRWLAALLPRRLTWAAIVAGIGTLIAGGITARYLLGDPYESNFRNLRSQSADIAEEQRWMGQIDKAFGQGISGGFVIALPRRDQVGPLRDALVAGDAKRRDKDKLFSRINAIDDLLPKDQDQKLAVLAEIRTLLSGKDVDAMTDADRAEALALRPPDDLRKLGDDDIPEALAWPFIEADGSRGKILLAMSGWGYEIWDAHDVIRYADKMRGLGLDPAIKLGGASFVFADVLRAMFADGPRATLASILGAILVVLLVVGRGRHGAITIACGLAGTVLMLACGALLGLKVNFLDFVALPITIGIGIDYSVNIVTRERQDGPGRARQALRTTGGAVFLCSYTTIVGYGSLLLSENLGIRSFGLAAMLGELTCLVVALILAPALLWVTAPRAAREAIEREGGH